jgi:hypothetical protein
MGGASDRVVTGDWRIKHLGGMKVSVRARARQPSVKVDIACGTDAGKYQLDIDKSRIDACMQMLHENESSVLSRNDKAEAVVQSLGNNEFEFLFCAIEDSVPLRMCSGFVSSTATRLHPLTAATASSSHESIQRLLSYAKRQVLPVYSTAHAVALRMQGTIGSVMPTDLILKNGSEHAGADATFFRSNACTMSKLVDMFNGADCGRTFSPSFAARMAMLASVFCATAPSSKSGNLFHVSQLQMTDYADALAEKVYEQEPQKQHLTLLMRGDSARDRIKRFNVAVRIFDKNSEFVRDHLPKVTNMNATVYSSVMVVTGVHNNQAAAIFLSSDSLNENAHSLALESFL